MIPVNLISFAVVVFKVFKVHYLENLERKKELKKILQDSNV